MTRGITLKHHSYRDLWQWQPHAVEMHQVEFNR